MFRTGLRSWMKEERGAVAVYVAIGTAIFFPMIALAVDATNYYKLHTELSQAADAAALAAATELDFTDEGLARAETAARTAVRNYQTGANDEQGSDVAIATVQFLSALPPAGHYNYAAYVTTDASKARYVRVITETRSRDSVAYGALIAAWAVDSPSNGGLKRTADDAVAGKTTVACRALPLMMCNPAEVSENCGNPNVTENSPKPSYELFSEFLEDNPEWRRRQFRIKWIGPQSSIEPGMFGLLRPITGSFSGNGANAIANELGVVDPSSCFEVQDSQLEVKNGQAQAIVNGLNVRFDIFRGSFGSDKNDPRYAPALDRTKGYLPASQGGGGSACDPQEMTYTPPAQPQVMKLPQDSCYTDSPSAACDALGYPDPQDPQGDYAGRYGDGQWDALTYFNVNHPKSNSTPWTASELNPILQWIHNNYGNAYGTNPDTTQVNVTKPPSRWSVYRWETAGSSVGGARITGEPLPPNPGFTDRIPGAHTRVSGITKEEGRSGVTGNAGARCSNQTPLGPARRTLNIAVVNCCAQFAGQGQQNNDGRQVTVSEFAQAFMTQPARANNAGGQSGDMGAIYIEIYNAVKATEADQVVLRDFVQLY